MNVKLKVYLHIPVIDKPVMLYWSAASVLQRQKYAVNTTIFLPVWKKTSLLLEKCVSKPLIQ